MADKVVKGIVNSRATDAGGVEYKVRYAGLDKSGDEWLAASAVSADHVQNFEARKAKKSAAAKGGAEAPKPEEKKRKAPEPAEAGAAAAEEGEESEGDSEDGEDGEERKKSWGAAVEADEVDQGNIITGPRRKRAAAAAAMQSSEWTTMLSGKLDALADSDSDDD